MKIERCECCGERTEFGFCEPCEAEAQSAPALESTWDEDCERYGVDANGYPKAGESCRFLDAHVGKLTR